MSCSETNGRPTIRSRSSDVRPVFPFFLIKIFFFFLIIFFLFPFLFAPLLGGQGYPSGGEEYCPPHGTGAWGRGGLSFGEFLLPSSQSETGKGTRICYYKMSWKGVKLSFPHPQFTGSSMSPGLYYKSSIFSYPQIPPNCRPTIGSKSHQPRIRAATKSGIRR